MVVRIVIDTNVLISAQRVSRELLTQCLLSKYQPIMSNILFAEYKQVINRDEILRLCLLSIEEIATLMASFMNVCEWIRIYYLWRPNLNIRAYSLN